MHKITLYIDFNIANMQIICKIYERYMHKYAKKIMLKLCTKYIECAQLYVWHIMILPYICTPHFADARTSSANCSPLLIPA